MATILIIEDDEKMQRVFQKFLRLNRFEVDTALSGEEGLKKAKTKKPSLILLDIMMPFLNGLDVLKLLKIDTITRDIPVLMLSNIDDTAAIREAISQGAEGYMIKADFTPEIILMEIERVLSGGT